MTFILESNALSEPSSEAESVDWDAYERDQVYQRRAVLKPHRALRRLRKELRDSKGKKYSKKRMAKILGIAPRAYQYYEQGDRPIPSDVLVTLKAEFDLDSDKLLSGLIGYDHYDGSDKMIDDALDVIIHIVTRYELKPDLVRIVAKAAIGSRQEERYLLQDPTIKATDTDIANAVKRHTDWFD